MKELDSRENYNKTFEDIKHIDLNFGMLENYKQF